MVDVTAATGAALFLIPLASYGIDLLLQFKGLVEGTERVNILNIRVALFLPFYAFFMVIGIASPTAVPALNIPLSIVESYSFYCFFVLLVANLGGSQKFVDTMTSAGRTIMCCNPCCPADMMSMYKGAHSALFHIIVTRNIVVIIAAIANYSGTRAGKAIYALLTAVCTMLLINALLRIFLIYEVIYERVQNVFNVYKVALLKLSISLIVLQGLICEFMVSFSAEPYQDDDDMSAEDKTYRGYCMLVLIEFAILSVPYIVLWAMRVQPSAAEQGDKAVTTAPLSFTAYLCRVASFWDIFDVLGLNPDLTSVVKPSPV